jgi:hypothetical protein
VPPDTSSVLELPAWVSLGVGWEFASSSGRAGGCSVRVPAARPSTTNFDDALAKCSRPSASYTVTTLAGGW